MGAWQVGPPSGPQNAGAPGDPRAPNWSRWTGVLLAGRQRHAGRTGLAPALDVVLRRRRVGVARQPRLVRRRSRERRTVFERVVRARRAVERILVVRRQHRTEARRAR